MEIKNKSELSTLITACVQPANAFVLHPDYSVFTHILHSSHKTEFRTFSMQFDKLVKDLAGFKGQAVIKTSL